MTDIGELYLQETLSRFEDLKRLGDGALAQLEGEDLHWSPGGEANSVALIVQHLSGNMHSRWSHFPEGDGEGAERGRDAEFEDQGLDRDALLKAWEGG